jgi:predicted  nucleic acid-binding Zn-ribbon protein
MYDNLKERLTDMSVLASTRTPADALKYIEELEDKLAKASDRIQGLEELLWAAEKDANEAEAYAEELEAKLVKAVEVAEKSIKWLRLYGADVHREAATLAELTGGKDE